MPKLLPPITNACSRSRNYIAGSSTWPRASVAAISSPSLNSPPTSPLPIPLPTLRRRSCLPIQRHACLRRPAPTGPLPKLLRSKAPFHLQKQSPAPLAATIGAGLPPPGPLPPGSSFGPRGMRTDRLVSPPFRLARGIRSLPPTRPRRHNRTLDRRPSAIPTNFWLRPLPQAAFSTRRKRPSFAGSKSPVPRAIQPSRMQVAALNCESTRKVRSHRLPRRVLPIVVLRSKARTRFSRQAAKPGFLPPLPQRAEWPAQSRNPLRHLSTRRSADPVLPRLPLQRRPLQRSGRLFPRKPRSLKNPRTKRTLAAWPQVPPPPNPPSRSPRWATLPQLLLLRVRVSFTRLTARSSGKLIKMAPSLAARIPAKPGSRKIPALQRPSAPVPLPRALSAGSPAIPASWFSPPMVAPTGPSSRLTSTAPSARSLPPMLAVPPLR